MMYNNYGHSATLDDKNVYITKMDQQLGKKQFCPSFLLNNYQEPMNRKSVKLHVAGSDLLSPTLYGHACHSNSCEYDSIEGSCHATLSVKPPR